MAVTRVLLPADSHLGFGICPSDAGGMISLPISGGLRPRHCAAGLRRWCTGAICSIAAASRPACWPWHLTPQPGLFISNPGYAICQTVLLKRLSSSRRGSSTQTGLPWGQ